MLKDARSRQLEVDYKQFLGRTPSPGIPFQHPPSGPSVFSYPEDWEI